MVGRRLTAVVALSAFAAVAIGASALAKPQPGALDPSFGGTGVVKTRVNETKAYASAVAIDGSHRIVAAASEPNGFELARYKPNGALDPSFSGDGMASVPLRNIDPSGASVAIGKDGAVTVAGGTCTSTTRCELTVARLTPAGELDPGFGRRNGKVTVPFGWATENGFSMALDSRGRVVIAGTTCKQHGPGHCAFGVVRLKQDGRLDQSFGKGDGRVAANIAPHSKAFVSLNAMAIDSRGRIILAGDRDRPDRVVLVRDKKNGSRDRSFGHHGIVEKTLDRLGGIQGIAITPKDKIVAAGSYAPNAKRKWALARFGRSGRLDRSFGKHGETAIHVPPGSAANDEVNAVALDSRNRIVVTGKPAYSLARFQPNGKLNRSFGHHGTVTKNFGEGWSEALAIDSKNRPVVAGGYPDFVLGRFIG